MAKIDTHTLPVRRIDKTLKNFLSGGFRPAWSLRSLAPQVAEPAPAVIRRSGRMTEPEARLAAILDPAHVGAQTGRGAMEAEAALEVVLASAGAAAVSPHPLFEAEVYLGALPDAARRVAARMGNPVLHFLAHWQEHRVAFSRYFDAGFYLRGRRGAPGLDEVTPLEHYLAQAPEDRVDANPLFHDLWYGRTYGREAPGLLADFLTTGHRRLYLPNPWAAQELSARIPLTPHDLLSYIRVK